MTEGWASAPLDALFQVDFGQVDYTASDPDAGNSGDFMPWRRSGGPSSRAIGK
jgi:hypothetical protein